MIAAALIQELREQCKGMTDAARLQELREQCSGPEAPGDGTYLKDSELLQLLDDLVEQRKTISALVHRIELTERDWRMEKERRIALPFVHADGSDCPTFYDGCNCSLEVLRDQITRAEHAEKAMEDAALALGVALGDPKVCWSDLPRLATWAADILSGPLSGAVKAEREMNNLIGVARAFAFDYTDQVKWATLMDVLHRLDNGADVKK